MGDDAARPSDSEAEETRLFVGAGDEARRGSAEAVASAAACDDGSLVFALGTGRVRRGSEEGTYPLSVDMVAKID